MSDAVAPLILTYKYRLNPEKRQHRALEKIREQQRQLYNAALEERIGAYEKSGFAFETVGDDRRTCVLVDGFALVQTAKERT